MAHNAVRLYVHLVWRTWDSLPLIRPAVERRLHRAIEAEAGELGCKVYAVGGTAEHVHLLLAIPATLSVSDLVRQVKGASSRFANEVLLPGRFRWQGHYGALSVSRSDVGRVRAYIQGQHDHHAVGGLVPELEEVSSEGRAETAASDSPTSAKADDQPEAQ